MVPVLISCADFSDGACPDFLLTDGACPDFCLYFNGSNRQGEEVVYECSVVDGKMIFDTGADL